LKPSFAIGTYNLHFTEDGKADYTTGPFSLNGVDNQITHPDRVGSLVWTPLHEMAANGTPYTLTSAGITNWNGTNLTMVDVTFNTSAGLEIGFGGQITISNDTRYVYDHATFGAQRARLLIETNSAVPIVIQTFDTENGTSYNSTWEFDPFFIPLGNGLVPRAFDWDATWWLHERQEFQVVGSTWLFKRGDAWYETGFPFPSQGGNTRHSLTCELLTLAVEMPMTVTKTTNDLTISLPGSQAAGFSVVAADGLQGPWFPVLSETSQDASSITVTMPTNVPAQYYRLTK
jgi:hypothetical protein